MSAARATHLTHEFAGKVVLVTGAAQGIGAAVARAFARGGATVVATDRQADAVKAFAAALRDDGARVIGMALDLCDADAIVPAVASAEAELGAIDVLVNVAGVLRLKSILETSDEDWADTFAVNTTGVFRLCRAVAARMLPRRRGAIVTVGSNASRVPRTRMAAYAASKAASAHFMRCLALELAPHGIRCNVVSPGSTDTAMQRLLWTSPADEMAVLKGSLENYRLGIPLARIASPDEIADAVCFLASERARHITMQDLCVDGGATLGA